MKIETMKSIVAMLSDREDAQVAIEELNHEIETMCGRNNKRKEAFDKRREEEVTMLTPVVESILATAERPLRACDVWVAGQEFFDEREITSSKLSSIMGLMAKKGLIKNTKLPRMTVYEATK